MHHTPDRLDPERIMVYGSPGAGKSSAVRDLVADGQRVIVIDTERAYRRMLRGLTYSPDDIHDVATLAMERDEREWEVLLAELDEILAEAYEDVDAARDWWLVIDSFTPTWDWCQASYIEQIHGKEDVNYFIQRRKEMEQAAKMGNPLDGNHDWTYINKMFNVLYNKLLNWPGHTLITAEAAPVDDRDAAEVQKRYAGIGMKPKGQKRAPHIPQTLILARKTTRGWSYLTVKDREREEMLDADAEDGFVEVYLVGVAEWESGDSPVLVSEMSPRERALARARG